MSWIIISLTLLGLVHAQQNVISVDDNSPLIVYTGSWDPDSEHPSTLDFGGSHTLSADPTATATFTFTGIAVSYFAPKWPYLVNSYVSLDGEAAVLVDMTALGTPDVEGHETVQSAPLWNATNLENTVHHVVVTLGPSGYAVVDGFQYTQATTSSTNQQTTSTLTVTNTIQNTSTSSSSNSTVPSESNNSTTTTSSNQTLIITISVSASVAAILIIALILVIANRRRKARQRRPETSNTYNIPTIAPMATFSNVQPYNPVALNDPYRPPAEDRPEYGVNSYSHYPSDMSQSDTLRYSGYEQGSAGNSVTAWGQYGLYPTGIPQPPPPGAAFVTPPGSPPPSASPNSQTTFLVPTNYNLPETQPPSSPLPSTNSNRSPLEPPPYASQYGSPSELQSSSQPSARVNEITNPTDPPKRRYEGRKG